MVYAIYEDFYPNVEKKLNRIARKCVRHGNDFIFNVKGEEIREKYNENSGRTEYYKFILVEVDGTAKIDDWECVAVIEHHDIGNIIRRINTEIEIPSRFKNTENFCEHCNTRRQRNNLFIIHNVKTDEWKQVGGSCLKLYTDGLNMEYVTAFMDGITELEEADDVVRIGGKSYYNVEDVISLAVEVIDKLGYFNANSNMPTKIVVSTLINNRLDRAVEIINETLSEMKINARVCEADFNKDSTRAVTKNVIEYYSNIEDDSEFIHNVKVMLNNGYILPSNIGFLSYLPCGYAKHIEKEVKRAEKVTTKHFGEIGQKYSDKVIDNVVVISSWSTQWGVTYVYKIVLEDGTVLTWKTSKELYLRDGESFDKITFIVKEHTEYKGEKQTEVTRCKITKK